MSSLRETKGLADKQGQEYLSLPGPTLSRRERFPDASLPTPTLVLSRFCSFPGIVSLLCPGLLPPLSPMATSASRRPRS